MLKCLSDFIEVIIPITLLLVQTSETQQIPRKPTDQLSINERLVQMLERDRNLNVDPCRNFYRHACGNWHLHNDIRQYSDIIAQVDYEMNKKLANLLETYRPRGDVNNIYNKVWYYYSSCKHEKRIEPLKYVQLVKPDEDVDWPILNMKHNSDYNWAKGNFSWLLTLAQLRLHGLNDVIMKHIVAEDLGDAQIFNIYLDLPSQTDQLTNPEAVVRLLSSDLEVNIELAYEITAKVFELEETISELGQAHDNEQHTAVLYDLLELEMAQPALPWRKYFEIIIGKASVHNSLRIQISNMKYFRALEILNSIDAETMLHYLMLRFLYFLGADCRADTDYIGCVSDVRSKMEFAINFIYKARFYAREANVYQTEVERIMEFIRQQYLKKLSENYLQLPPAELEYIKLKLESLQLNIGNLPRNADSNFINDYYSGAVVAPSNYYANHLNMLAVRTRQAHARLLKPAPIGDAYFSIGDSAQGRYSTAYYIKQQNMIIVPYSLLLPPLFHRNMHDIFKFSLFGFLLAHEVAHSLDTTGILYNHRGVFNQQISERLNRHQSYATALDCLRVHSTLSLNERIADVTALRLTHDILFGSNSTLAISQPNFSALPMQYLFFLNVAHFFCVEPGRSQFQSNSDVMRLHESISNFERFGQQFQCRLGADMHPAHKCRL